MSDPGDPTIRMPRDPGEPPPPPSPPSRWRDERLWWVAVGLVVVVAMLIVAIILVNGGDDDDGATGSSSSTASTAADTSTTGGEATTTQPETTTTEEPPSTTAAPTTVPNATITAFSGPTTVECTAPTEVELSWSAENTERVDLSIDSEPFASLPPSGVDLFPFACDGSPHTYRLDATGPGDDASQQLTINQTGTNA